jgi:hypothetical protein
VLVGLRRRSSDEHEKADVGARIILFGEPLVVAVALVCTRIVVNEPELLLAAVALLVGALLAGFAQVAGWRERVLERGRVVDKARIQALNEAGALILMSIHVSVVASAAVFGVALLELEQRAKWVDWIAILLSSIGPASVTYVALSLVFVANRLWDGFTGEQDDIERENHRDFNAEGDDA